MRTLLIMLAYYVAYVYTAYACTYAINIQQPPHCTISNIIYVQKMCAMNTTHLHIHTAGRTSDHKNPSSFNHPPPKISQMERLRIELRKPTLHHSFKLTYPDPNITGAAPVAKWVRPPITLDRYADNCITKAKL